MRAIFLLPFMTLVAACNVSTDSEDSSLTVDVNEDRLDQLGEDVETIATDIGQDIEQGAAELTDEAQSQIAQEAEEAEAEMDREAGTGQ
ncbi:hypothetical protein [Sphingomicrobium arenosum]|uniref:hypothetical protein n=1 Tax=Sphingomicrobium arenosum TaxID=2233861 RepID=UPI00223FF56D|nr:hypothetical protein [Sphingomicrobium arenosum]